MIFERMKSLPVDRMDTDEAVALLGLAKTMRAQYFDENSVPLWLQDRLTLLTHEVKSRHTEMVKNRILEVERKIGKLHPSAATRSALTAELESLRALVG